MPKRWYLIYTKPRQEWCALQNLEQQGYVCYVPVLPVEKVRQRRIEVANEPLFPRYLFARVDSGDGRGWGPIRFTRGVSRVVGFGSEPVQIDDRLIERLRAQEEALGGGTRPLFHAGDRVCLVGGAFAGIEGVYQMTDGDSRVIVLIEMLSKQVQLCVEPAALRKVG